MAGMIKLNLPEATTVQANLMVGITKLSLPEATTVQGNSMVDITRLNSRVATTPRERLIQILLVTLVMLPGSCRPICRMWWTYRNNPLYVMLNKVS